MPKINEFFEKPKVDRGYELESLNGIRACSKCDEDVAGATWDPVELIMNWKCSKGHDTFFKVQ